MTHIPSERSTAYRPSLLAMRPARILLIVLLLPLALLGCADDGSVQENNGSGEFQQEATLAFVQPSGDTLATIAVEIAESDAERKQGLMRRRSLGYDRGMLFIFDTVDRGSMWMKNTPMPLDIVFVAPDSQVINIARRTTPFSEQTIKPEAPRKFVVEVRAGFADRYGLSDSTRVRWTRTN